MAINKFGPPVRITASYASGPNNINNDFHQHDIYEIFTILDAEADYYVENTVYHLKKGDILLLNSKEKHKFPNQDNMNFSRLTIAFEPDVFRELSTSQSNILYCFDSREPGCNNVIRLNQVEMDEFLLISDKIIQLYNQSEFGYDILTVSHMLKLLVMLNRKCMSLNFSVSDSIPVGVKPIIEYVDKHLSDDLSLDAISKALKMNKVHVNRIMKKYTGHTVHKYVNIRRVSRARALISSGYSATDACFISGFNDYTSFARTFKAITGFTPREYKKR